MKSKLEQKIDEELAEIGVVPYVYHIRAYGEESEREILRVFNGITVANMIPDPVVDVERDVGEAIEVLTNARMKYGVKIHPATWMMKELHELGYRGIAICDRHDNFSRKRGRIIAKGRLLKYLKQSRPPELIDGTKW